MIMNKKFHTIHKLMLTALLLTSTILLYGQNTPNARQARRFFNQTYEKVFGSNGCMLTYSANVIGIYKCAGTIWLKGEKKRYIESRYLGWYDAHTYIKADQKKKKVEIHNAKSPKKDAYTGKIKFNPDDYNYHISNTDEGLLINIDLKDGAKSTIRHGKVILDKKSHYPKSLQIKVIFFWIKVNVHSFIPGVKDESIFKFDRKKFASYQFIDKRPEEK